MKNKKYVFKKNMSFFCLSGLLILFPISIYQNMSINEEIPTPSLETIEGQVIDLDLGGNSSGMIMDTTADGDADTLYMWGANESGQLGLGDDGNYFNPQQIFSGENVTLVDFEQGGQHSGMTVDTTNDGVADTLYMWGSNEFGQLGLGSEKTDSFYNTPQEVENFPEGTLIDLELGSSDSGVTVDTTGDGIADTLYMWGDNNLGELGLGNFTEYDTPQEVTLPQGELVDLDLGYFHSGVTIDTTEDGNANSLYMWGSDYLGQLGDGNNSGSNPTNIPDEIIIDSNGTLIDLRLDGYSSAISIDTTEDGMADTLYTWGDNESGQLGLGINDNIIDIPNQVTALPEGTLVDLEMGPFHMGATIDTTQDGVADSLYMWGDNESGQLGLGDNTDYNIPQKVDINKIGIPYNLQLGYDSTGIMFDTTADGKVDSLYMWGSNEFGQLGLSNDKNYNTPQQVGFFVETSPIIETTNNILWFYIFLALFMLIIIIIMTVSISKEVKKKLTKKQFKII
ncbi:MAG: hypothetical protein GQ557_00005 [Mycoplasmataceae bacterium]|nr:hypothetical protein [Mycoplasmataceae bacterium]